MKNELEHLYQAKMLRFFEKQKGIETDDYVVDIVDEIKRKACKSREKPDISGSSFGIEHTEIYPFEKSKKGDNYKQLEAENIISESVRKVTLKDLSVNFIDPQLFLRKLGIIEESKLKENIVSSIEEKSNKYEKYEKFEKNGIWLELPNYVQFLDPGKSTSYFMQDEIYNAMKNSLFDFFVYGNQDEYIFISKGKLIELKPYINIENNIILNLCFHPESKFRACDVIYTAKDKSPLSFTMPSQPQTYRLAKDILSYNLGHLRINIDNKEGECEQKVYLYSDDLIMNVTDWKKVDSNFIITYERSGIIGKITTDFMSNVKMESEAKKGETIKSRVSQHDAAEREKIILGVKRFMIDKGNVVDIYTAIIPYMEQKDRDIMLQISENLATS